MAHHLDGVCHLRDDVAIAGITSQQARSAISFRARRGTRSGVSYVQGALRLCENSIFQANPV